MASVLVSPFVVVLRYSKTDCVFLACQFSVRSKRAACHYSTHNRQNDQHSQNDQSFYDRNIKSPHKTVIHRHTLLMGAILAGQKQNLPGLKDPHYCQSHQPGCSQSCNARNQQWNQDSHSQHRAADKNGKCSFEQRIRGSSNHDTQNGYVQRQVRNTHSG